MKFIFITILIFLISIKSVLSKEFSEVLELELLKGWRNNNGIHYGGLKVKLKSGWKTYWRHPGETGFVPVFDWTGSQNLSMAKVIWPNPKKFNDEGMMTLGYEDFVILPIEFTPLNAGKLIKAKLNITLGICEKLCIPVARSLTIKLRASQTAIDQDIIEYLDKAPQLMLKNEFKSIKCDFKAEGKNLIFSADIGFSKDHFPIETALVELPDSNIWFSIPDIEQSANYLKIFAKGEKSGVETFVLSRKGISITLIGKNEGSLIQGC